MKTFAPSAYPWLPYVAPMLTYVLLLTAMGYLPRASGGPAGDWYPLAYSIQIAITALVAWACRSSWRDLIPRPGVGALAGAVGLGLGIAVLWVGLDPYYWKPGEVGTRAGFDPTVLPALERAGFLAVRFFGLVAVVPLIEELFWRSFLIRWIIDPEFSTVPIGRVTPLAAGVTAGLFALEHPQEWLPALLTGLAWAGLLWRTRSVSACVVSHSAANLGLGLYVVATGNWKYW